MLASRQLQSSWLADPYSTPITSISLSNSVYDLPRPHPPRGLKGFFSRSKSDHSEPAVISNPRVRPLAGSSTSRAPASSAARTRDQQRTPFNEVPTGRKQPGTEDRELNRSRPSSPDQLRRNIRFNPSVHPSIQKGKDGRWQPPSLSRGSMSTSALELYALEEGIARSTITPVEDSPMTKPKKGHKHTFSMLVSSKRLSPRDTSADKNGNEQDSAPRSAMNSQDEERTRANISYKMAPPAGSAASWVQMSPPHSPASPTTEIDPIRKSPASLQVPSRRSSVEMQHEDFKASSRSPPNSPRRYIPISPARSQYFRTRASASSSLPLPTHVESSADALISYEHDFLHLATSILIRNLTSTSNAEAVMQNGKDEVLRKLADENLFALSRMKEARDQARDTIDGEQPTIPVFLAARSFEPRIQATPIQESTSDKERKTFIGALQDGVLLCLLFNHLFPSNPANISRINISQDGTLCAANITRFTTACEAIGLSHTELFGIHDVHEASESSLRRVAQTITTLAVLPVSSATASPGRASQPTSLNPLPSPSRKQSPVPIRVRRAPPDGPAISPLLIARPSAATGQRDSICSSKSHYELQAHMDQQGIELNVSSAWRTPTTSAFELPSETHKFADPESLKYALSRATTEPIVTSDLLPRSPSAPGSPSRSDTPNGQPSNTLLRPALRSRRTTGFKTQVSFADQSETLIEKTLQDPRVGSRLNGEGLEASRPGGGDVVGDPRVPDDARGLAHLRSLAALEGRSALPPLNSSDASPRHRPAVRRGQSLDVPSYWPETDSLLEEDEPRSAGDSSLVGGGARPSVIRRFSANGKVYVPRRSMSPTSQNASPITAGFPFNRSAPARSPSEHIDRRQSDGLSIALTSETSNEPMNMKIHSMINLSSPGGAPPLFRELSNSVLRTVPLQILEFNEPGLPPVKYQLGNSIGRGQFGVVYRSLNLGTGQMVAIKRIQLRGMAEAGVCDVMREVELLKRLSHPGIVKYEGMSRDDEYLNIVLEFVENGSLGRTLKDFGRFNEKLVCSYVAKILDGLIYLHSQGVVHCDLKAANILSTKNGNIKLSDFGVSLNMKAVQLDVQTASKARSPMSKPVSDVAGTPNWMAPEVISLQGASSASDIWSLGCTIIELLTGKPPYAHIPNSMAVLYSIVEDAMPPLPENISDDLSNFLSLCFIKDPAARPNSVVMFEHPWVKKLNPEMALRPQDSLPFLRRVSMDFGRVDSSRLFAATPADVEKGSESELNGPEGIEGRNRENVTGLHGRGGSDGGHKQHAFIIRTFAKGVTCRICNRGLKKAGVHCQLCGLHCHTGCASLDSPRCDVMEPFGLPARRRDVFQSAKARIEDDTSITPPPQNKLSGWKRRTKSALMSHPSSSVDLFARRSSIDLRHPGTAYDLHRGSMDTNPSSVHSQGSMYSGASGSEGNGRRQSAIRFELGQEEQGVEKMLRDEAGGKGRPPSRLGKGHRRGMESKSDCVIM